MYGNNRTGGLPIHVYQSGADVRVTARFLFWPERGVQSVELSSWTTQTTLYADAYLLLGCKAGYVTMIGGHRFSVFFEAKNLTDERATPPRSIRRPMPAAT